MKKKLIIFDMDGLMIDSERAAFEAYSRELKRRGLTISLAFYTSMLGHSAEAIRGMFRKEYDEGFPFEEINKIVYESIESQFARGVPVKGGLIDLLQYLKANDFKTAVATSTSRDRAGKILTQGNLWQYLDFSICGDEVQKGKPDPEIFLTCCKKAGVGVGEALVLEDSEQGIQAANAGGIDCIAVPDMKYPEEPYRSMAIRIMNSLSEVLDLIRQEW